MGKPTNIEIQLFRADPGKHEGREGWLFHIECLTYSPEGDERFKFTSTFPLPHDEALMRVSAILGAEL